jgi:hypothetical protein
MMCPLGQLSVHIVGLELIRADCGPRRRRRRKKKKEKEKKMSSIGHLWAGVIGLKRTGGRLQK